MDVLRCLTPEMVLKELAMHRIAGYGRFARALKNSQLTSGKIPRISGTGH
jgi:hypothetical protein